MTLPKWKRFEDLATSIQRQLAPAATVKQNERIRGRKTGELRDVDIAVRQTIGQYEILVAIECKDYKRKVNVKDVEAFMGLADDVAANQAAMIAARGFSETAKTRARNAGIRLFRLVDAQDHDWKSYVSIATVVEIVKLEAFSLTMSGTGPFVLVPQNFRLMPVLRSDGTTIDILGNLILDRWERNRIPEVPGEHHGVRLADEPTFVCADGVLCPLTIKANVVVASRLYFGQLGLVDVTGLADELEGGLVTTRFRTDVLSLEIVQHDWMKITKRTDLAVQPVLELRIKAGSERIVPPAGAA